MAEFLEEAVQSIKERFERNFLKTGEFGAGVSVWMGGAEICALSEGYRDLRRLHRWTPDTIAPVRDAIHGPAAATVLSVMFDHGLNPKSRIGEVWSELACGTLADFSLGELLSHQCGLCFLPEWPDNREHEAVVERLNATTPAWEPGKAHGYHPETFLFILDELVRRISSKTLSQAWRDEFGDMLDLDIWIGGIPHDRVDELAERLPSGRRTTGESAKFFRVLRDERSLTHQSFQHLSELHHDGIDHTPSTGVASARSLAQFYSLLACGGHLYGVQLIPWDVCFWAEQLWVEGDDRVLTTTTAFSPGFMKDPLRANAPGVVCFGASPRAFGHPGSGGVLAFADPNSKIAFAYVMNLPDRCVLSADKALRLVEPLFHFD